jgi:hypothetical protein
LDISETLIGSSDQLDNVDLMGGPRVFTITEVTKGSNDQPLNIHLAEFPRPWRPGLTMRRLLAEVWGKDASAYVGRRVRLYRDAKVTFGPSQTGGTRLSHASHIDRAVTVTLPVSRGKFDKFTVEPLTGPGPTTAPDDPSARVVGLMKLLGFDKARMLGFASDVFGREISSAADLTPDEMAELADALERETGEDR